MPFSDNFSLLNFKMTFSDINATFLLFLCGISDGTAEKFQFPSHYETIIFLRAKKMLIKQHHNYFRYLDCIMCEQHKNMIFVLFLTLHFASLANYEKDQGIFLGMSTFEIHCEFGLLIVPFSHITVQRHVLCSSTFKTSDLRYSWKFPKGLRFSTQFFFHLFKPQKKTLSSFLPIFHNFFSNFHINQ